MRNELVKKADVAAAWRGIVDGTAPCMTPASPPSLRRQCPVTFWTSSARGSFCRHHYKISGFKTVPVFLLLKPIPLLVL